MTSKIEWTGLTWNPVVGCTKISPGCAHCFAERMAFRLGRMAVAAINDGRDPGRSAAYIGTTTDRGKWTGKMTLVESALGLPSKWKKSRLVFVNSMSDPFHASVPLEWIQRIFSVMNEHPQHTFQILTKRPGRAAELSGQLAWTPNIWMGTSVENQVAISTMGRLDHLRQTGATVKFLSCEPLLAPLTLDLTGIDWVIVGGESGPGSRPMKRDWVLSIGDQCAKAHIPMFFKQWGDAADLPENGRLLMGREWTFWPGDRHKADGDSCFACSWREAVDLERICRESEYFHINTID